MRIGYVSLSGDLASVIASPTSSGSQDRVAYVFEHDGLGNWLQTDALKSDRALNSFGFALTSTAEQVIVSSGVNSSGAVHVFSRVPEPNALPLACGLTVSLLGRSRGKLWLAARQLRV